MTMVRLDLIDDPNGWKQLIGSGESLPKRLKSQSHKRKRRNRLTPEERKRRECRAALLRNTPTLDDDGRATDALDRRVAGSFEGGKRR
jgi:hypothetical protein